MLEFEYVQYKNFQSIGNQAIKIDLNRSPTTVVGGHNGAGKSSLLEAISYALFGKPLKKLKLEQLVNTINKKGLHVTVAFNKNGKSYKVVRGMKPSVFEFWVDGELQDQSAKSSDYQAKVEYVLGMDYKLFTQIVVLNKEKYVPFMELPAADRRKVVEDILDISVFSVMSDLLKKTSSNLSSEMEDLKYERERLEERMRGQQRLIDEAASNVDGQIAELNNTINTLGDRIEVLVTENNGYEEELATLADI
jgi:DNA repair exonuclease SbcCD ATPase subunit